jgi:hypothetical protein
VSQLQIQGALRTMSVNLPSSDMSSHSPADKRALHRTWLLSMRRGTSHVLCASRANILLRALQDNSEYQVFARGAHQQYSPLTGNRHIEHDGGSCGVPHCRHPAVSLSTVPSSQNEHCCRTSKGKICQRSCQATNPSDHILMTCAFVASFHASSSSSVDLG